MMSVYLKESNIYYIGRFAFREEKGIDSWICLIKYGVFEKESNKKIYDPDKGGLKSSVVINLSNVERIELVYEDDSKVWQRMMGK